MVDPKQSTHTTVGTPMYMPPEVIEGANPDPLKHDVWSAGIILF